MKYPSLLESDNDDHAAAPNHARFVDMRSKEAEFFNRLLEDHIPDNVIR
jgi:hypothetical protein